MKRYFIYYANGTVTQQAGINLTYLQIHSLGLIKLIIDTEKGKMILSDKWEWKDIPEYHDSSLVVEEKIKNK